MNLESPRKNLKMDNELYNLCKQVYEATGWFEVSDFYVKSLTKKDAFKNVIWEVERYSDYAEYMTKEKFSQSNTIPLYTSDYLLKKLPRQIEAIPLNLWAAGRLDWRAEYDGTGQFEGVNECITAISDTPLKALLKLTLILHKEKLL